MTCRDCRYHLIEQARGAHAPEATQRHLAACPECGLFLEAQLRLSNEERQLAEEDSFAMPPPELEAALLAEFDLSVRRRKPAGARAAAWVGALAASVLAAWLLFRPVPRSSSPPAPVVAAAAPAPLSAVTAIRSAPKRVRSGAALPPPGKMETENDQPFLAIPYTAPLASYERTSLVRMDLPVSALVAAGLPVRISDPAAQASADVLVGEDGRARAVRVISISTSDWNGSYK